MKDIVKYYDTVAASIGVLIGWYLGSPDGFLFTLIAFVVVDYITGVLRAGVERKLSSSIGVKGIAKKIMIFIIANSNPLFFIMTNTEFPNSNGSMDLFMSSSK